MNILLVVLLIVAVRLASVFIVQTYYVPDEYWQSLEVAHKLTFGWVVGVRFAFILYNLTYCSFIAMAI